MSNEQERTIEAIAHEAIALASGAVAATRAPTTSRFQESSGAALERLGRMLHLQLHDLSEDDDQQAIVARIVVQTWLYGHALLLLGEAIEPELADHEAASLALVLGPPATAPGDGGTASGASLLGIARRLDAHMYGATDPPRAFQRHLRSFYDEVDITGVEGSRARLTADPIRPAATRIDYVRVSLWVLLFLAHDHYAAVGAPGRAAEARALFDRLRAATDEFYARRRQARSATSN